MNSRDWWLHRFVIRNLDVGTGQGPLGRVLDTRRRCGQLDVLVEGHGWIAANDLAVWLR